jgi:hypothetical protein
MDAVLGWKLVLSLPVILLVALLAGRLLGVQRSLAATALAGAAGWLSALALSLAIAEGDPAAAGFTRNLWVFAIVFTMSATVWIELLAKPGALARAQSGLVSIPRPLRAVRRSSQRLSRYAQITGIAACCAERRGAFSEPSAAGPGGVERVDTGRMRRLRSRSLARPQHTEDDTARQGKKQQQEQQPWDVQVTAGQHGEPKRRQERRDDAEQPAEQATEQDACHPAGGHRLPWPRERSQWRSPPGRPGWGGYWLDMRTPCWRAA